MKMELRAAAVCFANESTAHPPLAVRSGVEVEASRQLH